MAVNFANVKNAAIPEGNVKKIESGGRVLWEKKALRRIDLIPFAQDDIGWWNKQWTSCSGRGRDGNWMWGYEWIPVGAGKIEYDMVTHVSVGHMTAWDDTHEIGYDESGSSSRKIGEWVLPQGTKYIRVNPPSGISSSFILNYFRFVGEPALPSAYQELEYIESQGLNTGRGAYLDLGIPAKSDYCIDITMTPTAPETQADEKWFGSYSSGIFIGQNQRRWRVGGGLNLTSINIVKDQKTRVLAYGGNWRFNDDTASVSSFSNATMTMLVGACHFDGTGQPPVQYGSARYHKIQIKKSNSTHPWEGYEMVKCLIPCKRKSDGEIGMYDTVSGQFIGRADEYKFLAGPVIGDA